MLAYIIAVSESTPGPIMVNLATYVGSVKAGIAGSIVSTLAVVLPSFVIILLITALLKRLLKNKYFQAVLRGMKPCIIGIIAATGCFMIYRGTLGGTGAIDARALIITIIAAAVCFLSKPVFKKKASPILLIAISACLGMALYAI